MSFADLNILYTIPPYGMFGMSHWASLNPRTVIPPGVIIEKSVIAMVALPSDVMARDPQSALHLVTS
jgi:hypothetical protein